MGKRFPKSHMVKSSMSKSTVPKSPLMETSMSKSPMPRSPMPKSPVIYEKYKSRCAYGLISIFNFRRRHSKKLISDSDRRRLSRHSARKGTLHIHGDGYTKNRVDLHSDRLIDDELNYKTAAVDSGNCQLVHDQSRNQRKATRRSRRSLRFPVYGCYDVSTAVNTNPATQKFACISSKSLESAVTSEVLSNQGACPGIKADRNCRSTNCMQYEQLNEINLQVNVNEATEAFINKKLIDAKHVYDDGVSHQSKHFLDALQILNSNKDLFIKLLQDPNSLLVKHIEDLRESQAKEERANPSARAASGHVKSNTRDPALSKSKETSDCQSLENIIVLRPNRISHDSQQKDYRLRNVQQSVKPAFFPFEQMKRKLMRTMRISRKEKQLMLMDGAVHRRSEELEGCGKRTGIEMFPRKSPDKASSDFRGMTTSLRAVARQNGIDKVNEIVPGIREEAVSAGENGHENSYLTTSRDSERSELAVNVETRTNISELENGNVNLLEKCRAKTWDDGISSVPEYDFVPVGSSRGAKDHGPVSPEMRFSTCSGCQMDIDGICRNQEEKTNSISSPLRQNPEASPWNIDNEQLDTKFIEDLEEISPSHEISESDSSHDDTVNQSTGAKDRCAENGSLDLSRLDSHEEIKTSSSLLDDHLSSPSNGRTFREFDRIENNADQPSPVSVLDQFFTDDKSGPLNMESQPALPSIRRLQIGKEVGCFPALQFPVDLKLNSDTSTEEYGSMFEYVSSILQACHLNWDELACKYQITDQLLDPSVFNVINLWPKSCHDHKLLFDYVNEVLVDIYWHDVRCSPWLSAIKPGIPSTMITESILQEVMKKVDWNLLSAPCLRTLEKITERDLHTSRSWMDIQIDAEDVVSEMVDSIVEELTTEIALE